MSRKTEKIHIGPDGADRPFYKGMQARRKALEEATTAVELLHREHQGPERGLALEEAYAAIRALIDKDPA